MSLAGRWMRRVRFGLLCRSLYRDQYASRIVPSLPADPMLGEPAADPEEKHRAEHKAHDAYHGKPAFAYDLPRAPMASGVWHFSLNCMLKTLIFLFGIMHLIKCPWSRISPFRRVRSIG